MEPSTFKRESKTQLAHNSEMTKIKKNNWKIASPEPTNSITKTNHSSKTKLTKKTLSQRKSPSSPSTVKSGPSSYKWKAILGTRTSLLSPSLFTMEWSPLAPHQIKFISGIINTPKYFSPSSYLQMFNPQPWPSSTVSVSWSLLQPTVKFILLSFWDKININSNKNVPKNPPILKLSSLIKFLASKTTDL